MKIRKALCPDRSGKNHFPPLEAASSRLFVSVRQTLCGLIEWR
jgi:hypothetical protein